MHTRPSATAGDVASLEADAALSCRHREIFEAANNINARYRSELPVTGGCTARHQFPSPEPLGQGGGNYDAAISLGCLHSLHVSPVCLFFIHNHEPIIPPN
jgi:hypothetical protein